jgi:hypothetical protein
VNGHLSNKQALELFSGNGTHMSHLLLSHLSRDNNDPKIVMELFNQVKCKTRIIVASRNQESEIYHIGKFNQIIRESGQIQYNLF